MAQDKPVFHRVQFFTDAEFTQGIDHWPVCVLDLSLKGALVEVPTECVQKLTQGREDCTLSFSLTGSTDHIDMGVKIARILENNKVGLLIHHIDIDSISHLKRLVELNLGVTDVLEREYSELFKTSSS